MKSSLECLRHRGPDAQGQHEETGFSIGHTRLAIIDLKGGQQPLSDPSGRWWLTFNGEIFNYKELRANLAKTWHLRDQSDTEVLLAGLIRRGPRFLEEAIGMWAFALYDAWSGQLLLSRDRFGKKPLYYAEHNDSFAVASEISALRSLLPDLTITEDVQSTGDYFRYGYALPGYSGLVGIKEILPAHNLLRNPDGTTTEAAYWHPVVEPYQGSFGAAAERISELLATAVTRRRLSSDVEVGAFLSGGVDSTLVCALARQPGQQLRTFTAGFAEASYDERAPAAKAAAALGTRHVSAEVTEEDALHWAEQLPVKMGQPFGDSSLIPSAAVAALAAQEVKVVLTGDGSDEIFGGYARYTGCRLAQIYRRSPALLRREIERLISKLPETTAHHSHSFLKRIHLFTHMAEDDFSHYFAPPTIRNNLLNRITPYLSRGHTLEGIPGSYPPEGIDTLSGVKRMLTMDTYFYLPQDILQKVDRASMFSSLEARSPFLDRDLFEFATRLPVNWLFSGLRGKYILRVAMEDRAPSFIWRRKKQGFAAPVGEWFKKRLGEELQTMSLPGMDTGILDRSELNTMLDRHKNHGQDHSQALWLSYVYLKWRANL